MTSAGHTPPELVLAGGLPLVHLREDDIQVVECQGRGQRFLASGPTRGRSFFEKHSVILNIFTSTPSPRRLVGQAHQVVLAPYKVLVVAADRLLLEPLFRHGDDWR